MLKSISEGLVILVGTFNLSCLRENIVIPSKNALGFYGSLKVEKSYFVPS